MRRPFDSIRRAADQLPRLESTIGSAAHEIKRTAVVTREMANIAMVAFALIAAVAVAALGIATLALVRVR